MKWKWDQLSVLYSGMENINFTALLRSWRVYERHWSTELVKLCSTHMAKYITWAAGVPNFCTLVTIIWNIFERFSPVVLTRLVVTRVLEEPAFHILMKKKATVSPIPLVMTIPRRYIYLAQKNMVNWHLFVWSRNCLLLLTLNSFPLPCTFVTYLGCTRSPGLSVLRDDFLGSKEARAWW